jgi:hypothetical protein
MKDVFKKMNQLEAVENLDKFTLKFYFKKPESKLFANMNPQMAAEAEKAAKLAAAGPVNIQSLIAESKNYQINLKDMQGEPVFEMQNIVDFILRKVSECFLQQIIMNKNILQSATQRGEADKDRAKQESDYRSFEYRRQCQRQAEILWDDVIAMHMPHFYKNVRWDLFEENVIGYLLDKMNFSNDLLNKIQWKNFL